MKRNVYTLIISIFFLLLSCKKAGETVSGTYNGTVTINASPSGNGTTVITKVSDNTVNMSFVIGAASPTFFTNVAVTGSENPYSLSYSDAGGNLYGQVDGNQLIFTIFDTSSTQTTFTGSK